MSVFLEKRPFFGTIRSFMSASNQNDLWLPIIVGFPVAFLAIWCFVLSLLSLVGGWGRIARRFPGVVSPEGTSFQGVNGMVGVVSYRFCLKVCVSPEGLHVVPSKFFGFKHPPILIPWPEIHRAATSRIPFTLIDLVVFEVGSPKAGTMRLPRKIFAGQPVEVDGQWSAATPPPLPS